MRAFPVVTGAIVLLLVLGGCGKAADQSSPAAGQPGPTSPTTSQPTGSSTPGSTPAPPTTQLPEQTGPLPSAQVDTSALPSYYKERKVWTINGGRTLQLSAMARDACAGVTAKVVEQNQTEVRVVISPMDMPQGGSPDGPPICAQVLTPRIVTVDLKVPLGNRKVIVSEGP
jgi:hypothetical protein